MLVGVSGGAVSAEALPPTLPAVDDMVVIYSFGGLS